MFPRSRLPVILFLFVLGAAAVGHWLYWLAQPGSGIADIAKSGAFFFVYFYFPLALAGLAAVIGAALMLRWPMAGGILGTVALGVAVFYLLYFLVSNVGLLAACSAPGDCKEWRNFGWIAPALGLVVYLLAAIWKADHSPRRA